MVAGIFLIAEGVIRIVRAFSSTGKRWWGVVAGAVDAIIGIIILAWPGIGLVTVAVLFAVTIRGYEVGPVHIPELGLLVATPLAVIVSGLAAKDSKLPELLLFAAVLTIFCIGLFRYALGLSLPVAPWLIGY